MTLHNTPQSDNQGTEFQAVVLMTDMVKYSQRTSSMSPEELKDFIINYHRSMRALIDIEAHQPVEIEASSGDGALILFRKRPGENEQNICIRAVKAAIIFAHAIENGKIPPTRMGMFLGNIIEAQLGEKSTKFSTCFAIANRLEELCGYFGTWVLMDRQIAKYQTDESPYLVSIGKFSLASVLHPMNAYSVYKPGLHNCPTDVNEKVLLTFIHMKNEAMDLFSGNLLVGLLPDFPQVRGKLIAAQKFFVTMTGKEDLAISRILEYIRETPFPDSDFNTRGMKLMEKKRDVLGDRLFHLSKQLLRAMDYDIFHTLIVDTQWEQFFRLEWYKKGTVIIQIYEAPDGIYYLDYGRAKIVSEDGELLAILESGDIFGEMAYFGNEHRRTATIIAETDVVVRKIATADFQKLPIIVEIFRRIATAKKQKISGSS